MKKWRKKSLRTLWLVSGFLLGLAPGQLRAQNQSVTIVVLPLENAGSYGKERENFEALRHGLAALLAGELGRNPSVRVVGRADVMRALTSQGLGSSERFDRESIASLGKTLGADYLVTGSFVDVYGDFRIDARLVKMPSSEIVKVVRNDPALHDRADMFGMVLSVARALATGAPLPAQADATADTRRIPADALSFYSLGLLYQDRGDRAKAREYLQKALTAFPGFTEATEALRGLES